MRTKVLIAVIFAGVAAIGFAFRQPIAAALFPASAQAQAGNGATQQKDDGSGGGKRSGRGGGAVAVSVATAVAGDLPVRRSTIGWIASTAATTVTTQQQGVVTKIAVGNGQEVKAGDVLVQLDDRAAQAALARDQAALARDQTTVTTTKNDLQRAQDLAKMKVDSVQQLDQAEAAAASAGAVIALDQANIAADAVVVDEMKIRAPHSGRLGAFQVTVGSLVQPGNPVVTLTDMDNIEADFTVSDADVDRLRQAMAVGPVAVHILGLNGDKPPANGANAPADAKGDMAKAEGTVDFIDSTIVQGSGTMAVRASVPNSNRAFWPGEAVRIEADLSVDRNIVIVPAVAVQPGQAGSNVFVVKPDKTIDVRAVEVVGIVGDKAGIRSGIQAGEQVVTEGQLSLAAGMKVDIRGPASADDPGSKAKTPGKAPQTEGAS